jgi:hypothetical protein
LLTKVNAFLEFVDQIVYRLLSYHYKLASSVFITFIFQRTDNYAMLLFRVFAGIASLVSLAVADDATEALPMDLGSVLSRHPKLSTYYKLIQV